VLPYFRKSECLTPCDEIVIDYAAHNNAGPLAVSIRSPILQGAREFVQAAEAAGIPRGDYNGRDRGGAVGIVSLVQTNTRQGKRSSTYRAFLEGVVERRSNLAIITGAQVTRLLLENTQGELEAKGVEYRDATGEIRTAMANMEVVLSAGSVGSPHLLLLSGIGPRRDLETIGVPCLLDSPDGGKHLKDHVQVPLFFSAPGVGVSMSAVGVSMGPTVLRQPAGPLPADPNEDDNLPDELRALKQEAARQLTEWATTGCGLAASSLYEAAAWFSTGLGDTHSHDAQIAFIPCGYNYDLWHRCLNVDTSLYFDDANSRLAPNTENVIVLANPVLPRSEGEIVLQSADPGTYPSIRMNYFDDEHDMKVMIAVLRRALAIVSHWPNKGIGSLLVPPFLAEKHAYKQGTTPSDDLLQDLALHFSITVYHLTGTCRIGNVVDARLNVNGVRKLRVADASVMPNIVSGNTNAATVMIGEKAAEMIAMDHDVKITEFVGERGIKEGH
jgi:choline dehydrogenase-like flavoprotein